MALRMPKASAGALGLWLAVFFSCLISCSAGPFSEHSCSFQVGAPEVPDLQCYTDLETEVVCHWGVTNTTDCASKFRLHVKRSYGPEEDCVPETRRIPESASPSCVCVIPEKGPWVMDYTLSLVNGTNKPMEHKVTLYNIVKPRPLRNLNVTKSKTQSFILQWKNSYGPSSFVGRRNVFHQIQLSTEGRKQPDLINLAEQTKHFEIFADRLVPRKNHTARIRYKLEDSWGGCWSEWSSPCTWLNDFEPEPGDQLWWIILVVCFLVVALVLACYCCFARLKRQWWDQIPSPKIADDLRKKPCQVPWQTLPGDEGKVPLCATPQDLGGFMASPPEDGPAFPGRPDKVAKLAPGSRPRGSWEAVLTPEAPSVEPSLTICSPLTYPDPGTRVEEEEEEEGNHHIPRHDALVDLFLDILGGGDSAEDAETPQPAWEEPPPAGAPEPALGGLCLPGGTPRRSPGGSSESGYRNSNVATSSHAASPAPEQQPPQPQGDGHSFPSSQYKLLLFPQQLPSPPDGVVMAERVGSQGEGQGESVAMAPPPSGYKSFSSLAGQPATGIHRPWEPQLDFARVDQAQPLSSHPPGREDAPSWSAPGVPCPAESCLPGYRPFRSASQDPSDPCLGSPYKPLLEVFGSAPTEGPLEPTLGPQEAEREAWQGGPWGGEPLAVAFSRCMEEEEEEENSGLEGVRQGTERFLPQVPVATQ